ncbi:MAG: alpha/beta fold hydrolase [Chryseolinea sp.]
MNYQTSGKVSTGIILCSLFLLMMCSKEKAGPFQDSKHFSNVFQQDKFYRLYLPDEYDNNAEQYPVIYFFHGWGGRYKSDDNANLAYDKIHELVDKYKVILVMWDGNVDENQPRPYNMGRHEDVQYEIQMKDYFIELTKHIDSTYRTKADKNHRGVIGFSMGGLMSYFLAGKYPDMIGAAVSMTGSPEFFIGYPNNHTLYPVRYAFQNLKEVQLRFHNSTADELTDLNNEVKAGAVWSNHPSFDYWQFVGGHVVDKPGETKVFESAMKFVVNAFEHPLSAPKRWSHYDLYPNFSLYGYHVESNKSKPGYIDLSKVSKNGLSISSLKWLPDGPPIDSLQIIVTTPAIYVPDVAYEILRYDKFNRTLISEKLTTNEQGSLQLRVDSRPQNIAVLEDGDDTPDLVCVDYQLGDNKRYLRTGKNKIIFTFLNRGALIKNLSSTFIQLKSADSSLTFEPSRLEIKASRDGRLITSSETIATFKKRPPKDGSPPWPIIGIRVTGNDFEGDDELMLHAIFDVEHANATTIDDGKAVKDSTRAYGRGNGDHIVNNGERVMAYYKGHRLRLYTDDPFVRSDKETLADEVIPAKWPDGFTQTSIIEVASDCPDGHVIECLASYETKDFMPIKRNVHWLQVSFPVKKMRIKN